MKGPPNGWQRTFGYALIVMACLGTAASANDKDRPIDRVADADEPIHRVLSFLPEFPETAERLTFDDVRIEDRTGANFDIVVTVTDLLLRATDDDDPIWFTPLAKKRLYAAAMETGDCRLAHDLVWDAFVDRYPFLSALREDGFVTRIVIRNVLMQRLPDLATCLYYRQARTLTALVKIYADDVVIGPELFLRPFQEHESWFSASESLQGRRDWNFWQLIDMATNPHSPNYGPAGLTLVELALELDSIDLPDEVLHMLLLRADATWPDEDKPLHISRSRISELLPVTAARLTPAELADAERCAMSRDPYQRLFLGEQAFADIPVERRCLVDTP